MLRYLVIVVHALLLICAALPAAAWVPGDAATAQSEPMLAGIDLAAEAAATDERDATGPDIDPGDDPLEAPELFAQWQAHRLPLTMAARPLGCAKAPIASPYLKGPQRPPKAQALCA